MQRLGCHFSFALLHCPLLFALSIRFTSSSLLFHLLALSVHSLHLPSCIAFSLPLILLAHLSFYLSHIHLASLSNELKSSHTLLAHLPHFSCEIKAAFLVCNHNAIAPLSHSLCASIAVLFNPSLKTSSV